MTTDLSYRIVCKRCGQTKGKHSAVKFRCPIAPPYPESEIIPGLVDRFHSVNRWKKTKIINDNLSTNNNQ